MKNIPDVNKVSELAYRVGYREVFSILDTDENGLSQEEAERRLSLYGNNEIPEKEKISLFTLFFKQFNSFLIFILLVAAGISFALGHVVDAWVILFVVVMNAIIGFIQEYKAENDISSLKKILVQEAKVLRNSKTVIADARNIVPGDIIIVHEGDSITADARVISANNFRTIESSLTGESLPVNKTHEILSEGTAFADRRNMIWKGTFVAGGYAKAVVTATGARTAIGRIATSLMTIEKKKTNFQIKTDKLGGTMAKLSFANAFLIFTFGILFGDYEVFDLLLVSIAALVSAIPEGLPAVLTIVLAIGARRMASRNAILRDFSSIETIGSVSAIITDKTGTLTQNLLTVSKIYTPSDGEISITEKGDIYGNQFADKIHYSVSIREFINTALISNNSSIDINSDTKKTVGDPTEGALLLFAVNNGAEASGHFKKIDDLPFNSRLKLRATLCYSNGVKKLYLVGAPERILERCKYVFKEGRLVEISLNDYSDAENIINSWSSDAMRIVGLASRDVHDEFDKITDNLMNELVFLGLAGMMDPPRAEAREAVEKCHRAGIRVIMATGDHKLTARAIAIKTGIINDINQKVYSEDELLKMSEEEFNEAIQKVNVFSRLTPNMKLRIASFLQQQGQLIAMTGDGVNDAPALKKADIGISMGIMGTDVARDASKLVLADDNFATIVNAVEEGRMVFRNARKASFFLVTTSLAELGTILSAIFLGLPIPLTATQILWLNLVTDGMISIPLATEKKHKDILNEKPLPREEPILNKNVFPFAAINMTVMILLTMAVFNKYYAQGIETARTAAFTVMAFTQLFNAYNMRSLNNSLFNIGVLSNKLMNLVLIFSFIIQSFVIYHPFFRNIFHFGYIAPEEYIILILSSVSVIIAGEIFKFTVRVIKSNRI